ncbi:hypothetical protein V6N11_003283 [Hibiscus sabdariffa]|uniref:Myb/SANT-like domain-containing protein n=1 Tax=Hibiscus sabdariffa TaxID=183260 RepID=A0ABR2SCR6_9ROSI
MPIEKGHLKNRIKTLKHNFFEYYDLFECRSGFAWSPDTKMWTATPELWKVLAKAGKILINGTSFLLFLCCLDGQSKPDAKKMDEYKNCLF